MLGELTTTSQKRNRDPSSIGWPPTLAIEIALGQIPRREIFEAYSITREQWEVIRNDPLFQKELEGTVNELKKDGVSFKMKARLQAEELLQRVWQMTHASFDHVPPAVQADLMKFIVRAAGLDGSKDQGLASANGGTALQINIDLSGKLLG